MIEKSARGVYILPEVWDDEMFNLQNRFKRGIYSHETALFLWEQCRNVLYDLGITEVTTPEGNIVKVYSEERTLCDILRPHAYVDIQIVTEAFKRFVTRTDKNILVLSEYAKKLRVEKRLRAYLEVLL